LPALNEISEMFKVNREGGGKEVTAVVPAVEKKGSGYQ
jgi:hypothetical protein